MSRSKRKSSVYKDKNDKAHQKVARRKVRKIAVIGNGSTYKKVYKTHI